MEETERKERIIREYQKEYKRCLVSLGLAKKIVNKDFIKATLPPEIVVGLRKKWLKFFDQPEFRGACRACQGACCSKMYYTSLRVIELFYILWQNPEFEFPSPDWRFLRAETEKPATRRWLSLYPCLFLSGNGCLLGENRSNTCLFHFDCRALELKAKISGLNTCDISKDRCLIEKEFISWSRRILEYFGIKSVGDSAKHSIIVLNYIIFPECSESLRDMLKNRKGGKEMSEKPVFCPKDNVELGKVQKEYKGEFYLLYQCPVCLALAPVFASSSSRWANVPEAIDIDDKTMAFIESTRD